MARYQSSILSLTDSTIDCSPNIEHLENAIEIEFYILQIPHDLYLHEKRFSLNYVKKRTKNYTV